MIGRPYKGAVIYTVEGSQVLHRHIKGQYIPESETSDRAWTSTDVMDGRRMCVEKKMRPEKSTGLESQRVFYTLQELPIL